MWLTRLAFWYLPDPRFTRCLGGFGPKLDPSLGGGFPWVWHPPKAPRFATGQSAATLSAVLPLRHSRHSTEIMGRPESRTGAAALPHPTRADWHVSATT